MDINHILDRCEVDSETGCWNWQHLLVNNNPAMCKNYKLLMTNRVAYEIVSGEIPKGSRVLKSCGNKLCCNPEHSYLSNWTTPQGLPDNRKIFIIMGTTYESGKQAKESTGVSYPSLRKFTDNETRIFDVEAYRQACIKAHKTPKI